MRDLIDRASLYKQVAESEEKARDMLLKTSPSLPSCPTYINPAYVSYNEQLKELTRLKHMIADAPTIESPYWTPCSERLPKIEETGVSMMVLLCWSDGQVTVGAYAGGRTFVGQAWPKAKGANVRVIAWMPLPEPYEMDH